MIQIWVALAIVAVIVLRRLSPVAGSTLGIVGYGALGREIERRATAFGMKVLINDVTDVPNKVDVATILREADVGGRPRLGSGRPIPAAHNLSTISPHSPHTLSTCPHSLPHCAEDETLRTSSSTR